MTTDVIASGTAMRESVAMNVDVTQQTATIHRLMPLCETLGVTAHDLTAERVTFSMAWDERLCTSAGLMHGGAIMALADSAGAAIASFNLPEGAVGTSTIESKTNFLGAVRDGTVVATATPLHVGSTTIVVETEVRHGERLVAKVTQTQAVLRPRT
jgi:1,4-dihydroxy-2-naphthoyl-CoA hydrolase